MTIGDLLRRKECESCKILREWNAQLQGHIGILEARISDLQDQLKENAGRIATERKELEDVISGRLRLQQPPPNGQVTLSQLPRSRRIRWPDAKAELEADARRKVEMFQKQMKEAEDKGHLPKLEDLKDG